MARKFLDRNDPFFAPAWRRWATTLLPLAWGIFEFVLQQPFWGMIFVAAGLYAGYELILKKPSGNG